MRIVERICPKCKNKFLTMPPCDGEVCVECEKNLCLKCGKKSIERLGCIDCDRPKVLR